MAGIIGQSARMVAVDGKHIESVGYLIASRQLFIKLRGGGTTCYEKVPGFRHSGLMAAPRKDAYFDSFIKHSFLGKPVETASPG
jgi:hypothetical protein